MNNRMINSTIYILLICSLMSMVSCERNTTEIEKSAGQMELTQKKIQAPPLNKSIEKNLIAQAKAQFYLFKDYDLEALDEYAPTLAEMEDFYKVFDVEAFRANWPFFDKNYEQDNKVFGEDVAYDQDLIKRITARASVLRVRSNLLTYDKVDMDKAMDIDTVFVKSSEIREGLYDLHVRMRDGDNGIYEMYNQACWLTDRGCLNNQGWSYLGRYNEVTGGYIKGSLNAKPLDNEIEQRIRQKNKGKERKEIHWNY